MEASHALHRHARLPDARPNVVPRELYEDPDLFPLEIERIFRGPIWHVVAHRAEIPRPHDFKTAFVGDVPIIVNHGDDGQVRAFLNSCAHRGTMVETRLRGSAPGFHCPYHRWSYDTKGCLTQCPGQEDFPEYFHREDFGLKSVRVAEHYGLIFVTLHPDTPPLADYLGPVADPLRDALGGDGRLKLLGYQKVVYDCNWKVYVDQDGYHPPLLHAAFRLLNWQGGKGSITSTDDANTAFVYETAPYKDNGFLKDASVAEVRGKNKRGGRVISLFPLSILTDHLDVLNPRFAHPVDERHTEVHFAYFAHEDDDPDYLQHRVRQSANLLGPSGLISLDDATVFLRIQKAGAARVPNSFLKGVR
ncbi:MAG: aromatic ring-hydroxylating oxygenase subunit alpha, partial [Candidatus Binatia bacterium]